MAGPERSEDLTHGRFGSAEPIAGRRRRTVGSRLLVTALAVRARLAFSTTNHVSGCSHAFSYDSAAGPDTGYDACR